MLNTKGLLTLAAFSMLTVPAFAGDMGSSPDVTTGLGEQDQTTMDQGTTGATEDTFGQEATQAIEQDFAELDADQDGNVTQMEFSTAANIDNPDQVFNRIDEDADGQISESDLENYNDNYAGETAEEDGGGWFQ
jgi:Ca2+-binding EF-hand superfamily protein